MDLKKTRRRIGETWDTYDQAVTGIFYLILDK